MGSPASSDVIKAVELFVQEYMRQYNDSSHDWLHADRVRNLAVRLAKKDMAHKPSDLEMVELAALLHDVGDFKFIKDGETGPQIISRLLSTHAYPQEKIEGIIQIVENVSYRHELEHGCSPDRIKYWREFTFVQDSDRLEAIGAVGVARCFAYNGRKNLPFYVHGERPIAGMTAEEYNEQTKKNGGSARFHFDEKLCKLESMMKSDAGKAEAKRRHEFMLSFMDNFDEDCGLSY